MAAAEEKERAVQVALTSVRRAEEAQVVKRQQRAVIWTGGL